LEGQFKSPGHSASKSSCSARRTAVFALLLSLLLPIAGLDSEAGAQVITLKLAANVPVNSLWDQGLMRMAAEFDRASNGKVKIVIPPTTRTASDSDIIRKMRLGVDGALLNTYGLAELYPDSLALSMPSYVGNDKEFDAVLAAVIPLIKSKLGDRYILLSIVKGGWVRFFSRSPIVYPADIARLRISLEPDSEKEISFMQSLGARVVPGYTTDFILQLNSNGVDVINLSPIYIAALWSQLRGKISYMSSFRVAPFVGAIVFNKESWEKIPTELRPRLERIVLDMSRKISLGSAKLEEEAIASLDGIQSPPEPPEAAAEWGKEIAKRRRDLFARMFSTDFLDSMDEALAKVRSGK
jgi:TRAP-type C4-dicarboxylate transport system substrate-binding protein